MERKPIESSVINSVAYDPNTRVLEVEFKSGSVYEYYDVPEEIDREFMSAASHGQYFLGKIRDVYEYKKISEEKD